MDGLLVIDKPAGITSHDVVNRVRRILGTRRVGHTGTLDPFATGVLVVLVGKATRLAQFLDKDDKEYEALIRFGFETDTGDVTGASRERSGGPGEGQVNELLISADWPAVFARFTGEIEQVPPMYSAKKVSGKKLYEHARKGVEIARKPVAVTIRSIDIDDSTPNTPDAVRIRVVCSAGTYIRTLAEDIGRALGIGAHLAELRRTRSGRFDLSQSVTLGALEELGQPDARLLPIGEAVTHLPEIRMADDRVDATKNGLPTRLDATDLADGDAVRMLDRESGLLAIGRYHHSEKSVRPKVVLV